MTGYVFHPEAFADLDQIWDYIAERNVEAADRVIEQIFDTLKTLASSPCIGHQRADLGSRPILFMAQLLLASIASLQKLAPGEAGTNPTVAHRATAKQRIRGSIFCPVDEVADVTTFAAQQKRPLG
jgi:plasmid stabilization system protein ParE